VCSSDLAQEVSKVEKAPFLRSIILSIFILPVEAVLLVGREISHFKTSIQRNLSFFLMAF
jgi:hypothetical protein